MPDVNVGVIQQFLHPPIGLCQLSLLAGGPYGAGDYTLTRPSGPLQVDAFGLLYSVVLEDAHVGIRYGILDYFDERVVQLIVHHRMLSGETVITQSLEGYADSGLMMFIEALPFEVLARVGIGFSVDFYWVLL